MGEKSGIGEWLKRLLCLENFEDIKETTGIMLPNDKFLYSQIS